MPIKKTPPFPAHPDWTTAKFFGFIRSGLREKFNRWPPKYETLDSATRVSEVLDEEGNVVLFKSGRRKGEPRTIKEYQCNSCKGWFRQKEVQVDHITPAGSLKDFSDLPGFVERMFVGVEGLQVLCSDCHDKKTKEEKA